MAQTKLYDLRRILQAARYSGAGLGWLIRHEAAFRQELVFFMALLLISALLGWSAASLALEVGLMVLALIVEVLNTAIEKLVDRISLDRHPLSGLVKDLGSLAVALSFIPLALLWSWKIFS